MFAIATKPLMIAIAVLGLLLALSMAGNAWLFNSRDAALEAKAKAETAYAGAMSAANLCSASVDDLAEKGRTRHAEIMKRLAAQSGQVRALEQASIEALQARPSDPSDLCASLDAYLRTEILKAKGMQK